MQRFKVIDWSFVDESPTGDYVLHSDAMSALTMFAREWCRMINDDVVDQPMRDMFARHHPGYILVGDWISTAEVREKA